MVLVRINRILISYLVKGNGSGFITTPSFSNPSLSLDNDFTRNYILFVNYKELNT